MLSLPCLDNGTHHVIFLSFWCVTLSLGFGAYEDRGAMGYVHGSPQPSVYTRICQEVTGSLLVASVSPSYYPPLPFLSVLGSSTSFLLFPCGSFNGVEPVPDFTGHGAVYSD